MFDSGFGVNYIKAISFHHNNFIYGICIPDSNIIVNVLSHVQAMERRKMKTFEEWKEEYLKWKKRWGIEVTTEEVLKGLYNAEKKKKELENKYEFWVNGCACESCKHCHTTGDNIDEPMGYECSEGSEQLGFVEGCYNYEWRKDE